MARLKLTPELQKTICNYIEHGVPMTNAAHISGICNSTFYNWYGRGRKAKSGRFRDFYNAIQEAKAKAIALRVENIRKAGEDGSWQADAWWLERMDPENFSRKDNVNVKSENINHNLNINLGKLFDDGLIEDILKDDNE